MSNKLKRKAKKKTFDFGEYTISLPSGTMLESFIKYTAEEPWNIDRVTDFLDAHSARVRKKVEKNQSFSQQEMDEGASYLTLMNRNADALKEALN